MADTCTSTVRITGDASEIKTLVGELREALAIPDSGNCRWLGNLWLHMDMDTDDVLDGKLGGCSGEIESAGYDDDTVTLRVASRRKPQLKPVRDFAARYAPSASIEFFSDEPMAGRYLSNAAGHALMLFGDDDGVDTSFMDHWQSIRTMEGMKADMAAVLGMDPSEGFDAVADAFQKKYPVEIHAYAYADLDEACA